MEAALIHNPVSGHPLFHRAFDEALARLRAGGWDVETMETQRRGHSFELAQLAIQQGYRTLIVVGGDGSIQQTIDGIYHSESQDVRLGIIPLGTGNVFARYVGLPFPKRPGDGATIRAAEIILAQDAVPVDIGKANDHAFLCWAGVGIDAMAAIHVESKLEFKRRAPLTFYVLSALRSIFAFRPEPLEVVVDGEETIRGAFPLVVANNIGLYARWLWLAPDAAIDDGLLDLVLFTQANPLSVIGAALHIWARPRAQIPAIIRRRCRHVAISADSAAPFHLDGDPLDTTPLTVQMQPYRLPIFLDRAAAEKRLSGTAARTK